MRKLIVAMKEPFTSAIFALFSFFCLIACDQIGPYRDLEISVITEYQLIDLELYYLPDSTLVFRSTYDLDYQPDGTLHLSNIPDGNYWLHIGLSHYPGGRVIDTTFEYKTVISLTIELPD